MHIPHLASHRTTLWLATALLLLFFALALLSSGEKSPTFDEQGFLTRGLGYLRGDNRHMRVGHPLGLNALNAIFLAGDSTIRLPTSDPSWEQSSFHRPSELFMWEIGNDVARILFLGRLPTIWLGMLMVALVGRWAWAMSRSRHAGLLALSLVALDPNILAHSRLATTDLGLAAAASAAGYTLWRFLRSPSWQGVVVAGAAFGLLQNTKFTSGLFVPLFALVILAAIPWWIRRKGEHPVRRPIFILLVGYPLAAIVTLWAAYGFDVGTLPNHLPLLPQLAGRTMPLAHHLEQLLDIGGRMQKSTPSFLIGRYSDHGWWAYFPIAFLLKTPLPTLALLLAALFAALLRGLDARHRARTLLDHAALVVPPIGYFGFALTTDINLGYRHLLPLLPFLATFIAFSLTRPFRSVTGSQAANTSPAPSWQSSFLTTMAIILLGATTLKIYPHYLAYFNLLAGGPEGGWRYLVDSNLDWGQDLGNLARWMEKNEVEEIWLSYFGEGRPDYYGISYTGLDSFPPRLMNPGARPFYPYDPAPGVYAISATTLQGVHFRDHDRFAWFRERMPRDKIGYSIFIYEVPPYGEPAALALSGIQLDEIAPGDFALLETNQVTPRWFDSSQSWLISGRDVATSRWLVLAQDAAVHPQLQPFLESLYDPLHTEGDYKLFRQTSDPLLPERPVGRFRRNTGELVLWQASGVEPRYLPGETLALQTTWEQAGNAQPLKIFVHVISANGDIVAQWDGLGAEWRGWHRGDYLYQRHEIALPAALPAGDYELWLGIYKPDEGERWQIAGSDRLFLGNVEVRTP